MKTSPNLHPLVEKTKKSVNKSYLDKGCIRCGHNGLAIRVSPNSLDRAFKVMDTLIKTLEEQGAQVSIVKEDYKNVTSVNLSGVALEIDIYEKINIIKKNQDQFGFNQFDYIPNGQLVLRIKNAYGVRGEWKDGKRKKLEDLIDSFIEGLYAAVAREKELQKERDQWKEEQRKRNEQERLKELERERIDNLEKEAMSWHRSKIIRDYIEASTAAYIQKNGKIEPGSKFGQWKAWANQQADCLDPLIVTAIISKEEI